MQKPGGGGGGGHSPHDWLRTRVQKKSIERVCFSAIRRRRRFPFKKGCFFILHRTLGVPRNKMLETLIHNAILGYLSQHHNN